MASRKRHFSKTLSREFLLPRLPPSSWSDAFDFLIRTRTALYVGEIKYCRKITAAVIEEVQEQIRRPGRLSYLTIRPFLVHAGQLAPTIMASDYFDTIVSMEDLLKG